MPDNLLGTHTHSTPFREIEGILTSVDKEFLISKNEIERDQHTHLPSAV